MERSVYFFLNGLLIGEDAIQFYRDVMLGTLKCKILDISVNIENLENEEIKKLVNIENEGMAFYFHKFERVDNYFNYDIRGKLDSIGIFFYK